MLGTIVVRQGKQGTIVRIDDGRIAIHTKSTIYMAISLGNVADICRTISFLSSTIQALYLQPVDKAIVYNIAMIQQKSAELLFSLQPGKRTLADLERGIARAVHAQKMFGSLATDPASAVPYDRDLAEERKKYADSMLRRAEEHLSAQRQHEAEQAARVEGARQRRAAERERVEALEVRSFLAVVVVWGLILTVVVWLTARARGAAESRGRSARGGACARAAGGAAVERGPGEERERRGAGATQGAESGEPEGQVGGAEWRRGRVEHAWSWWRRRGAEEETAQVEEGEWGAEC